MDTIPHSASNNNLKIPATSGIYKITCTTNGKIYIGSAMNLSMRQYDHFSTLRRNTHKNPHLQRAFNKYGKDAFTFEVLELVLFPEMLTAREQYWFSILSPFGRKGYNIAPVAGSNLGRPSSLETCEKIRQSKLGKQASPEHVEANRQGHLGKKQSKKRKGRKPTAENLAKMRVARSTPEALEKLRITRSSPEYSEKQRQAQLDKNVRPETKEKLRQAGLKRTHTPKSIEKMKLSWIIRKAKNKGENN